MSITETLIILAVPVAPIVALMAQRRMTDAKERRKRKKWAASHTRQTAPARRREAPQE